LPISLTPPSQMVAPHLLGAWVGSLPPTSAPFLRVFYRQSRLSLLLAIFVVTNRTASRTDFEEKAAQAIPARFIFGDQAAPRREFAARFAPLRCLLIAPEKA
jgi:hypothetical protein